MTAEEWNELYNMSQEEAISTIARKELNIPDLDISPNSDDFRQVFELIEIEEALKIAYNAGKHTTVR